MYKFVYKIKDGEKVDCTAKPANPLLPDPAECPTPELKKLYTAMCKEVNCHYATSCFIYSFTEI